MKRFLKTVITVFALCLCASVAHAQSTLVTGTVTDPNGYPYAGATLKAVLLDTASGIPVGSPTVTISNQAQCTAARAGTAPCQIPIQGTFQVTLDSSGNIPGGGIILSDNTQVTPSGTQWLFTVQISPGISPPAGTGPQTFSVTITISGASQTIGATLNAVAPALSTINLAIGNLAVKNSSSDAIRIVSSTGNDSNDGLSWGAGGAKQTVMAALQALPGGSVANHQAGYGTVMMYDGTGGGGISPGGDNNAVNILGSNDPHWNNTLLSCSRSSNVVTLTFNSAHNYITSPTGQPITVYNTTGGATSFNGNFTITGGTATTLTYAQSGPNESCTGSTGSVLPQGFIRENASGFSVRFVGYGVNTNQNSPGSSVVRISQAIGTPVAFPFGAIQLSGTNAHYSSDGIAWRGCYPIVLGRDSNFAKGSGASTFGTYFNNWAAQIAFGNNIGCGPAVEIGSNVIWAQFNNGSVDSLGQTLYNISTLTRSTNVTTVVLSGGPGGGNGWAVNDQIYVQGFSDVSYNGVFKIASVVSNTQITYSNLGANCASSCGSGGTVGLGPNNDRRAAVLFDTQSGINSLLVYFTHTTFNGGGGVRATTGPGNGSNINVEHVIEEGVGNSQPIYECTLQPCPSALIIDPGLSDSGDTPPAVRIAKLAGNDPTLTTVICGPAPVNQAIAISGPAITHGCPILGGAATSTDPNVSPLAMNQRGLSTQSGGSNGTRMLALVNDLRRNGSPINIPYANLATTAPASWTNVTGGALTITTGIADVLRGTSAANLTVSSGDGEADSYSANRTVKAGDYFFAGAWVQASTTAGVNSNFFHNEPVTVAFASAFPRGVGPSVYGTTGHTIAASPPAQDDGAWQWVTTWDSVNNAATTVTQLVTFKHFVHTGFPENIYAPILLHVPISAISRYSAALTSVSSGGGFATFTTTATHQFVKGQIVCINDVVDTSYNGCTPILFYSPFTATTFTVAYTGASTSSTGGTAYASADSEAAEIAQALAPYSNLCSVGTTCFPVPALAGVSLNVPFPSGTGLQIFNTTTTCTTAATAGATCTTAAISLPAAEADTAYRVTCTGKGITNVPVVIATTNSSATQFTITIAAITAAAATFASYDCVAGHN